jgi:mono/diheme cytochrome c family protein
MTLRPVWLTPAAASLALAVATGYAVGQKPTPAGTPAQLLHFESKVRPVLLKSCVNCHGEHAAQGGLRLDKPITPAQAKEVVIRIKGEGGKPRMPIGPPLSADKISAIDAWVTVGAPWPQGRTLAAPSLLERGKSHWAFQPLRRPSVPKVRNTAWVRNPIDAFVLRKLEEKGLSPNRTATRRELIRRLYYDLIGLPPTPEEVAAFEADPSPKAYENLVEKLLASPHYGEKWGRHWLDVVRYAETNSYERDNPKPYVHQYRDYVIRSFNSDKPYDVFVKEQIAGDEMRQEVGDSVVATGFYRLGIWDDEPADRTQAVFDDLDDIIATMSQAFLGLTVDCARCHDHKLDPITQKDYYGMMAFLQNVNRFKNGGPTDEAHWIPTAEAKAEYDRKMAEIAAQRKQNLAQIDTLVQRISAAKTVTVTPTDVADCSYKYYERDWKRIPDFENEPVIRSGSITPPAISIRPRDRNEEFAFDFNGNLNVPEDGEYTFRFRAEGGYRFTVAGERLFDVFASDDKATENVAKKKLTKGRHGFSLIFNQRRGQHGLSVSWSGPGFSNRPLSSIDSVADDGLDALLGADWRKQVAAADAEQLLNLVKAQTALEKSTPPTEKALCVTESGPKPGETFILLRGDYNTKGPKVDPTFVGCISKTAPTIPPAPEGARTTGRRTVLANWIASPENPMTARVYINRLWQGHFGRGIVRTPNDFGLAGIAPTHPELLNWLAKEFIDRGWSIKAMHRLVLNSNTYKQSSQANAAGLKADPQNDLFWRFDMRRLHAEEIRDSILSVCGNLNPKMFGPGVYPEIHKDILAAQSRPGKDWYTERMKPEDVNRRSIYIFVKRSLIYPLLASFDLPETDRSTAFRFTSTQPTQALGMMNGDFVNRQAVVLADRVRKEAGTTPRAFAKRVLSLVTQRTVRESEIVELCSLMERLMKRGSSYKFAQNTAALAALNLNEFMYID